MGPRMKQSLVRAGPLPLCTLLLISLFWHIRKRANTFRPSDVSTYSRTQIGVFIRGHIPAESKPTTYDIFINKYKQGLTQVLFTIEFFFYFKKKIEKKKAPSPSRVNARAHFACNLLGEAVQLLYLGYDISQCGRKRIPIDIRPAPTAVPLAVQIHRVHSRSSHLLHLAQQTIAGCGCRGQVVRDRAGGTQGQSEGVEVHEDDSDSITAESKEWITGRRGERVGMEINAGLSDLNEVLEEAFAGVDEAAVWNRVKGTAEPLRGWNQLTSLKLWKLRGVGK